MPKRTIKKDGLIGVILGALPIAQPKKKPFHATNQTKKKTVTKKKKKKKLTPIGQLFFLCLVLVVFVFGALALPNLLGRQNKPVITTRTPKSDHDNAFIQEMLPYALQVKKEYGLLPSVTLGQAALESNFGDSELAKKYYNYFGIKSLNESEDRVILNTIEIEKGQRVERKEPFRAYYKKEGSFKTYGSLLTSPRYESVANAKTYAEAATALYKSGYSTDPDYPKKLVAVIESHNLGKYDNY